MEAAWGPCPGVHGPTSPPPREAQASTGLISPSKRRPRLVSPLMTGLFQKQRCWCTAGGNYRAAALLPASPSAEMGTGPSRPSCWLAQPCRSRGMGCQGMSHCGDSRPPDPNSRGFLRGGAAPPPAAGTRGCGSSALGSHPRPDPGTEQAATGGVPGQMETLGRAHQTTHLHGTRGEEVG